MYSPKSLKINNIISHVDSHYEFKNGRAIVIVGVNHDNKTQKGNGAGKSALIESLALAFTGTSMRDVKVKELLTRGAKDGEIELILTNSQTKKDLKIWRKLYSGTKSSECRIWLGEEEVRLPDVNTYNRFIFDEIGLSKDDFFNFYLLTSANFMPFLRVGDTKKKEIINRFSGADQVDKLIPAVKLDLVEYEPKIALLTQQISSEQAKHDVLQEKIDNLNNDSKEWTERQRGEIFELQQKIEAAQQRKETVNKNIKDNDIKKADHVKQLDALDYLTQKQTSLDTIDRLQKQKATLVELEKVAQQEVKNAKNSFTSTVDKIIADEKISREDIVNTKAEIKEFEGLESEIQKQLQDSIECPKCHHKFSVRNKEFNHDSAKEELVVIGEELKQLHQVLAALDDEINITIEQRKQDVNKKILEKQETHKNKISELITQQQAIEKQIAVINQTINTLETKKIGFDNAIKSCNQSSTSLNDQLKVIDDEIIIYEKKIVELQAETIEKEIEEYQKQQEQYTEKIAQYQKHLDDVNEDYQKIAQWEVSFKNFKSYVANQSIKNIEDYTNLFLHQMGSDLTIAIDGFSTLASGKIKEQISTEVLRGGFNEGSYGTFSGGERGRIDICVIIAIQQLINLNCKNGGLDLLVCDEVLDQIDTLGLESIVSSLQNLDRTIMIVSQNEINTLKDYTLTIEKRNKVSTFVA